MKKVETTTAWEVITPIMADAWLREFNRINRSISIDRAIRYAEDIERGKWITTHQGIAFDEDGVLIDGAHRLAAITMAGLPVRLLVTRGLPKEARFVIDQGKPRSVVDAISLDGGTSIRADVVSMAKNLLLAPLFAARIAWSPAMVREVVELNQDLIDSVTPIFPKKKRVPSQATLMALVARAADHAAREVVEGFARILITGEGSGKAHEGSIIRLRDWLRESPEPRQASSAGQRVAYQKAQAVLRAYQEEKQLPKIYAVADDLFPLSVERQPAWFKDVSKKYGVSQRIEVARDLREYDPQKRTDLGGVSPPLRQDEGRA